ncbi:MAG: hypothetical protein AB7P04_03700 [Bacteriovoracia bacterium]
MNLRLSAYAMGIALLSFGATAVAADETSITSASSSTHETTETVTKTTKPATRTKKKTTATSTKTTAPAATSNDNAALTTKDHLEMVRRERLREELKNEDLLQARIEEMRLRDERRRTQELMNSDSNYYRSRGRVRSDSDEVRTGQASAETAAALSRSESEWEGYRDEDSRERVRLVISPRVGVASMSGGTYSVGSRVSVGGNLGIQASSLVTLQVGYAFNEYGVNVSSTNPVIYNQQYYNNLPGRDSIVMKQNVFSADVKLNLLRESKVRPFVTGGGAYSKSYINYDQALLNYVATYQGTSYARDYEVGSWLANVGTGVDFELSRSISLGAAFNFYKVLSANENYDLNVLYYGYNYDKQSVGSSLARSSFYTITGGVNFAL